MSKILVCPICGHELGYDKNFNVVVSYYQDIEPDGEGNWVPVGGQDFLEFGSIYCQSCGNTFDRLKEQEQEIE